MDETKLGGLLRNTAAHDPLEPIDAERVVRRGERGVRRRRVAGVTSAVAAVAAITWGATALTDVDTSDGTPPVATTGTEQSTTSDLFTPLPGVPRGDAALAQTTKEEVTRRCKFRHPDAGRAIVDAVPEAYRGGLGIPYAGAPRIGGPDLLECGIPGDSRPTRDAIALATRDPFPTSDAGKLRNCSVDLWHDITGWRLMASDTEPGILSNIVAVSPSGRYAAWCSLSGKPRVYGPARTVIRLVNPLPDRYRPARPAASNTSQPSEWGMVPGGIFCHGPGRQCPTGWLHDEIGRLKDARVVRIRFEKRNGEFHDVKVLDGWYALAWADKRGKGDPDVKRTMYDAAGKVIK